MGVVRRHVHKLAYVLITVTLLLAFALGTLSGFRVHRTASIERQTIRTQSLETRVLEHDVAGARSAYANLVRNEAGEAARLRPSYLAYLRDPSTSRGFERAIESELARQSRAFHDSLTSAREAVISLVVVAALLVLTLLWLFELERRAGRIDRDNAARAEELIRLRDEFVAVVSHELRTPLTSIIGYVELLGDDSGALTAEQRSYLEIVERSTGRLVDLVGDLLLVAEAERGPLALELTEIEVASLVSHAVEAARPAADARGVDLRLEPGADAVIIAGDPTRLAQMLDNLVSNAIKFTPPGGRVDVRGGRRGTDAVLEIADTGAGIADGDRAHVFEAFFRSRDANVKAVPGTGLGLTITKAIVDAHNGTIEVESTPGGGTTFRVWLPLGERIGALSR